MTTRIQSTIQKTDTLARLGGDEFIILSPYTKSNLAAHRAQELINVLHPPFELEHEEVFTGVSIRDQSTSVRWRYGRGID
ncbi:GGDEF domain-containing protein [Exiguobacterium sp. MER 193]|uniref:diguanylate cyclase domain-containing protein n=1 Tax=Exiguobacterium sp. MER 193 TaxID=2939564 RepID=UPI00203F862E|nr:GGDEF domain-containing protein [Exiguobacterium sp. MER 193]